MKKTPLLNGPISALISRLGHGQLLVIADAGLPIPANIERIDLALVRGQPSLTSVIQAVLLELAVESVVVAQESLSEDGRPPRWLNESGLDRLPARYVTHEQFKELTGQAVAVIRTGECTPYANLGLVAGVSF